LTVYVVMLWRTAVGWCRNATVLQYGSGMGCTGDHVQLQQVWQQLLQVPTVHCLLVSQISAQ